MNKFVKLIIFILTITIAIIAVLLAAISFPAVIELLKYDFGSLEFNCFLTSDKLKFLPSFVVSIAVFTALLTYLSEKTKLHNEKEENRSNFFLEQAKEGLEAAYDMLKDQNNNRIAWVQASRNILHALNLSKEIKSTQYQVAYQLFEEKIRHNLYLALTIADKKTGARQPLPPQFFYGVADWDSGKSLDDVAKETSTKFVVSDVNINNIPEDPHLTPLPIASIVAVYNFLEYPKDYADPLKNVIAWDNDWEDSEGVGQGAKRFVSHKSNCSAIDGKLHKNS